MEQNQTRIFPTIRSTARRAKSASRPPSSIRFSDEPELFPIHSKNYIPHHHMSEPPFFRNILETRLDDDDGHFDDHNLNKLENRPQTTWSPERSSTATITKHGPIIDQNYHQHQQTPQSFDQTDDQEDNIDDEVDEENRMLMMMMLEQKRRYEQEVGIYGWRKKILYILLAIILLLVAINLALVFWIISSIGFSSNGINGMDLDHQTEQIKFKGTAWFQKLLFADEVRSRSGETWLKFTSKNENITFRSIWEEQDDKNPTHSETKLTLTKDRIILTTDKFEIYDRKHELMFALDVPENNMMDHSKAHSSNHRITLNTNAFKIQDKNKLTMPFSLQTTMVDNSINDELRLFSPQGRLLLRGPKSVHLESKLGDGNIITFDDLNLKSNDGRIILDSGSIYLRRMFEFKSDSKKQRIIDSLISKVEVFQLCICSNSGRLFVVKADSICQIDSYKDC